MWGYFWFGLLMMLAGAFVLAVGVFYGMFMMSVAMSDDDDDDEISRYSP